MSGAGVTRADLRAARDDLRAFGAAVGVPLEDWQAESLECRTRFSVLLAPRRTGKSRGLGLLAVHRSLRRRNHRTLIVSAGEDGARRLLAEVRRMLAHPLLAGAVLDEQGGLVTFANGSEVRAVPASEKAIRGYGAALLLVDEAAFVSDDLLFGAALPVVAAEPDAQVVLASTPWEASGAFFSFAQRADDPDVTVSRWPLERAWWVDAGYIALMRATMPALRFRAEFEAQFVDGGAGLFSRMDLLDAVAPYEFTAPERATSGRVLLGCDFGNRRDSHTLVMVGVLDDHDVNPDPVLFVPWLEASQRPYSEQVDRIQRIAERGPLAMTRAWLPGPTHGRTVRAASGAYDVALVLPERNGVGASSAEQLRSRLGGQVRPVVTTQQTKERAFGRLQALLGARQFLLPDHPALLRELSALEATPTENGGVRITGSGGHPGDLAMGLSLALLGLPEAPQVGRATPRRTDDGADWLTTPSGLLVPTRPGTRRGGLYARGAVVIGA